MTKKETIEQVKQGLESFECDAKIDVDENDNVSDIINELEYLEERVVSLLNDITSAIEKLDADTLEEIEEES